MIGTLGWRSGGLCSMPRPLRRIPALPVKLLPAELDDAMPGEYHCGGEGNGAVVMGIGGAAFESRASIFTGAGNAPAGSDVYERFYPYYAELAALSELRKKPGFGVPIRSG